MYNPNEGVDWMVDVGLNGDATSPSSHEDVSESIIEVHYTNFPEETI